MARLPTGGAPLTEETVRRDGRRIVVEGYCAVAGCRFLLSRHLRGENDDDSDFSQQAATLFERALLVAAGIHDLLLVCRTRSSKTAALAQAAAAAGSVKYAADLLEQALDQAKTWAELAPTVVARFRSHPLVPTEGRDSSLTAKVGKVADLLGGEYPLEATRLRNAVNLLEWLVVVAGPA